MKDFDVERNERPRRPADERTFRLGGETFVGRDRFRPDVIGPLERIRDSTTDPTTCKCGHRLHEHKDDGTGKAAGCAIHLCQCELFAAKVVDAGTPLMEQIAVIDETILGLIEDGADAHGRYRKIRERTDDPVEIRDLMDVVKWLTSGDTGRPTGAPDDSSSGREHTGTSSTPASSSPDTPAA